MAAGRRRFTRLGGVTLSRGWLCQKWKPVDIPGTHLYLVTRLLIGDCDIRLQNGTDGKALNGTTPHEKPINITEEMCKTSLWKTFDKGGSAKKSEKSRKGSKSGDKHKHKHRHHHRHRDKHNRHKKDSEGQEEEDEGLWMLGNKDHDDDDGGSDAELQRKLAAIDEDKNDVVIDMDQIQESLLEMEDMTKEAPSDQQNGQAPVGGDAEAPC